MSHLVFFLLFVFIYMCVLSLIELISVHVAQQEVDAGHSGPLFMVPSFRTPISVYQWDVQCHR